MSRSRSLLTWYESSARDLPWRRTADPYHILVSEVMLQQTQAVRVAPAYEQFIDRFPSVDDLAGAPLAAVLEAWQGLGYPVRAVRLRDAAGMISKAGWPDDLESLPGVGPYTAAAIASFGLGRRAAVVDTNVRRVLSRWVGEPLSGRDLRLEAQRRLPDDHASWNQAIMELGALLCRPSPHCGECPARSWCADPTVYQPPRNQPRYEGSLRQVRGDVLRVLGRTTLTLAGLIEASGHDPERVEKAVAGLERDGLVARTATEVTLAD